MVEVGAAGRMRFKALLDSAEQSWQAEDIPEFDAANLRVTLCVTCMRRELQLMAAMAINVCLWWSLRKYWRLVIVTFCEDQDLQTNLAELLAVPIASGNVVLASGGTAGEYISRSPGPTDRPTWMPRMPKPPVDPCCGNPSSMPKLEFWHASVAKNTSHMVGMFAFPNLDNMLINLDCDQLVPLEYIHSALIAFGKGRAVPGFCLKCTDVTGPLTGRLGYRQKDSWDMQGYDEIYWIPSSGQDIDMRDRLWMMAKLHHQTRLQSCGEIRGSDICGQAFPNDFTDTRPKHDRGYSKVVNCDPAIMQKFGTNHDKLWSNMATKGNVYWKEQKDQNLIIRNSTVTETKAAIGSWWVLTHRKVARERDWREGSLPPVPDLTVPSEQDDDMEDTPSPRAEPVMSSVIHPFVAEGLSFEVLVVGAAELWYKFKTQQSCLGRRVNHVLVWSCGVIVGVLSLSLSRPLGFVFMYHCVWPCLECT